jgi:hypothetical protein
LNVLVTVYEVTGRLPEIAVVRDRAQALAMLDARLYEDPGFRYYSFDPAWSETGSADFRGVSGITPGSSAELVDLTP